MPHIVVVGAGFAGVWTAIAITRAVRDNVKPVDGQPTQQINVTVIAPTDDLVIRPRLYEKNPEKMRVPLDHILGPIGVRRIHGVVVGIDTSQKIINALRQDSSSMQLSYDKLVLASGSQLVHPTIAGADSLFNVDTLAAAADLQSHIANLPLLAGHPGQFTAVVVGAGFTGIELATELPDMLAMAAGSMAPCRVVLLERSSVLAPTLGSGLRPYIQDALDQLCVQVQINSEVLSVSPQGVKLRGGEEIAAATVVWTTGMAASPLTQQVPGRHDRIGRLEVDEYFRVKGVADVFAAGDTAAAYADKEHTVMQSCQHAVPQGKYAGANVAFELLDLPLVPFSPDPYVTCLDLGPVGAVFSTGWDRDVQISGQEAKQLKRNINSKWIYPPVGNREVILALADYHKTWPIDEVSA